MRDMIVQALVEPWGWPSALAGVSAQLIKQDPAVRACIERAVTSWPRRLSLEELFGTGELAAIASDRLLRSLLEATPNQDISLERFLTNVRFAMLQLADGPAGAQTMEANVLELCCALARQCFINDYVFDCSTGELEQVQKVCGTLSETLRNGGVVPALWPAIVAAYRPLHSLPEAVALLQRSWPDAVTALLVQQVRESSPGTPVRGIHAGSHAHRKRRFDSGQAAVRGKPVSPLGQNCTAIAAVAF